MGNILKLLEESTNGKCYKSFRYCADDEIKVPTINYEESKHFTIYKDRFGETDTTLKKTKDLTFFAQKLSSEKPLFRFFLDGSRRTYKVDDIEINRRIFPIMAGQICVSCCVRNSPSIFKPKELDLSLVLSLPSEANPNVNNSKLFLNNLKDKINQADKVKKARITFSKVLSYSSKKQDSSEGEDKKYEHLGIATIQDEMIESELKIVASLTSKSLLNEENYLLKDGSLQYKPVKASEYKELAKIKNNYRWAIGVSKLFNPELCKDKSGRSNAAEIAKLGLYHRTPAYMYQTEIVGNVNFCVWYVRIRDPKYTESPFAGVVKIEKILITESENEQGLDSDLIDIISANIINERNPVCYGKDSRWANHLYPVYLTEQFLKSKYLSDIHFLNLF